MAEGSLVDTLRLAIDSFRLGMEAAGSEALIAGTGLLVERISGWSQTELQELNPWLERIFEGQRQKNYLYVSDLLEYQVLPLITAKTIIEKGFKG